MGFFARFMHIAIPERAIRFMHTDVLACYFNNHFLKHVILGPDKWADNFPIANGPRQSPIDIAPAKASYDAGLKPLNLKYDPSTCLDILNNGHSFQVTFVDDSDSSS